MRTYFLVAALVTFVSALGAKLHASENFTLETHLYVYRNSDFRALKLPAATATDRTQSVVFRSPATVEFDEEKLSLDGPRFAWSGGRNPPARFTLIASPTIAITRGKPVTLASAAPVQYLEKLANGTLQMREIAADSPEAPHCRLTLTLGPASDASKELHLAYELDIATVSAREKLPGVTLDVGKPVLAQIKEKLEPRIRPEEWSALQLQTPNRSDYSLLMLIKIIPGTVPGAVTGTGAGQAGRLMTKAELHQLASTYYRAPRPELIGGAIEALGSTKPSKAGTLFFEGFFAEAFAANPQRMEEWQKVIALQDKPTRALLNQAVHASRPGGALTAKAIPVEQCWGAFFASGNPKYLHKLVDHLKWIDEHFHRALFSAGTAAMWSLASNAPEHPLVRPTLEAARTGADKRTREIIDDLLKKDATAIEQQLVALRKERRFRDDDQPTLFDSGHGLPYQRFFEVSRPSSTSP